MKQCELCEAAARLYCESDRASLCWECDAKVHGANFLVGRHSRCLLCRRCQSPTPWRADGARLGPTVSVCERCCLEGSPEKGRDGIRSDGEVDLEAGQQRRRVNEDEDDDGDEEEEEDEEDEQEEESDEIQVVPWTLTPPPPASSSSSEGEESIRAGNSGGYLKRTRETADRFCAYQDDPMTSSSQQNRRLSPEYESTSFARGDSRPFSVDREGSETRPTAALDVRVRADRSAVGVVSHGHCRPPI